MFVEVVKTLFDLVTYYNINSVGQKNFFVRTYGNPGLDRPNPVRAVSSELWETFKRLYPKYKPYIKDTLSGEKISQIEDMVKLEKPNMDFSGTFWSSILFSYLSKYKEIDQSKKRILIESLLPLYFARIASFVEESRDLNVRQTEDYIQAFVAGFKPSAN